MSAMDPQALTRASKFLSLVLRHKPEEIGLTLQPGGWVLVSDLLAGLAQRGRPLTLEQLRQVVAENNKQRFLLEEDAEGGARIRASQGHSVPVDLQLTPRQPPPILYHGTAAPRVDAILREGLVAMARQHVHLSVDRETARAVGARHGKPVILQVDAAAMVQAGHAFYCSDNGVWLAEAVPAAFLRVSPKE